MSLIFTGSIMPLKSMTESVTQPDPFPKTFCMSDEIAV